MRIVCPDCGVAYEVPDRLLQPSKTVRCARCGSQWQPAPAAPSATGPAEMPVDVITPAQPLEAVEPVHAAVVETADPIDSVPAPEVTPELSRTPAFQLPAARSEAAPRPAAVVEPELAATRESPAGWMPWIVSLLLVAAIIACLIIWRDAVMHIWPPSARLFNALGLGGAPSGTAPPA